MNDRNFVSLCYSGFGENQGCGPQASVTTVIGSEGSPCILIDAGVRPPWLTVMPSVTLVGTVAAAPGEASAGLVEAESGAEIPCAEA